jgi:hypothetical protein
MKLNVFGRRVDVVRQGNQWNVFYPGNEGKEPDKFDPIILDFRNRYLDKRILEEPRDKIFITYVANHLSGWLWK